MNGDAPISWLMFFTLAAGIVVATGFFLQFLRSRHNRAIAAMALGGTDRPSRGVEPDGAGAELGGLLAVALIAMALLAFGYRSHAGSAVGEAAGPNNQLATERTNPVAPKPYQPQNPAPDTRSAPTGSSTGSGPDSGGHLEGAPK